MSKKKESKDIRYQRLVEEETLFFEATELISELLDEEGVTRKEFADRLGRSKGYVTQVLAGDRNMTLKTLADLAFALHHRVELATIPLGKGDSGVEGGNARPPVARVRVGVGELARRNRCCHTLHPPQLGCADAGASMARTTWRVPVESPPTSSEQIMEIAHSRAEIDRVAG